MAARGGDEAGFATLWRDLHPRLLRYLRVRGDEAPEDLAAETWMHVVRGLPTFEGGVSEFRAWFFTIARHRAIDQGRARSRGPTVVVVADPAEVVRPDADGTERRGGRRRQRGDGSGAATGRDAAADAGRDGDAAGGGRPRRGGRGPAPRTSDPAPSGSGCTEHCEPWQGQPGASRKAVK